MTLLYHPIYDLEVRCQGVEPAMSACVHLLQACVPTQYLQFVCQSACVPMVASVWLINVSKCLLVAVCALNEYSNTLSP